MSVTRTPISETQARETLAPLLAEHQLPDPPVVDTRSRILSVTVSTLEDLARWSVALDRPIRVRRLELSPNWLGLWLEGDPIEFGGLMWDVYGPWVDRVS